MTTHPFSDGARTVVFLSLFLWSADARAQGPQPPCGSGAAPSYPDVGAEPAAQVWRPGDLGKNWSIPACIGWTKPGFSMLVSTAARFRYAGGADSLLRRIGAISELTGVRYWSASNQTWKTLIVSSNAIVSASDRTHRADFAPDEIRGADAVYLEQADNLMGKSALRLRVTECTATRIVVLVENVSAVHFFLITVVPAGEMQSAYFFDRESPDVWRFYSIIRLGAHASSLYTAKTSSSINRAVAFYRHYAGIPTDQEPPAARRQ